MGFITEYALQSVTSRDSRLVLAIRRDVQCFHHKSEIGKPQEEKPEELVLTAAHYLQVFSNKRYQSKEILRINEQNYSLFDEPYLCLDQIEFERVHLAHEIDGAIKSTTFSHKASNLALTYEDISCFNSKPEMKQRMLLELAYERKMVNIYLSEKLGRGNYISVLNVKDSLMDNLFNDASVMRQASDANPPKGIFGILFESLTRLTGSG